MERTLHLSKIILAYNIYFTVNKVYRKSVISFKLWTTFSDQKISQWNYIIQDQYIWKSFTLWYIRQCYGWHMKCPQIFYIITYFSPCIFILFFSFGAFAISSGLNNKKLNVFLVYIHVYIEAIATLIKNEYIEKVLHHLPFKIIS